MDIIHNSFFDVVKNSINEIPSDSIMPLKRGYLSKISMIGTHNDVFLCFNKAFLRIFCLEFLDDSNPSEQALEDMARELANLVVGRAKVMTEELGKKFNISTPEYLGHRLIKNYDHGLHFRLKSGRCSIYMRRVY
ncbi:chemotaxis protein CheX [Helicobacter marmotae]|uniref:Chemotaxis protein CheX n=1 Tax=Helicobacter marmotae TaxID=152490 RepID=A0A3D8I4P4_9HELI|nr:chemotaxis protein CheX [Helicobacter marmotae]RDU60118.1 chemotaxis protein CheX [Helicobacter marmotae]